MTERIRAGILAGGTGLVLSVVVVLILAGVAVVGNVGRPSLKHGTDGAIRVSSTPIGAPGDAPRSIRTKAISPKSPGSGSPTPSPEGSPDPQPGGVGCTASACEPGAKDPGRSSLSLQIGVLGATVRWMDSFGAKVTIGLGRTRVQIGASVGQLGNVLRGLTQHRKRVWIRLRK